MSKKLKDQKKNAHFCLQEIQLETYKLDDGTDAFKAPKEVQLMRTGSFDHPFFGEFEITEKVFKQMVTNFNNKVRRIEIAFDYGHENGERASGWIEGLRIHKDETLGETAELLANVKWTPDASKAIVNHEWKYTSAEFMENYKDTETKEEFGWTLFGAALTNRPFIKGMEPVLELSEEQIKNKKIQGDNMDLKEMEAKLTKLSDKVDGQTDEIKTLNESNIKLSEENASLKKDNETLKADKIASEKAAKEAEQKAKFDEMLKKGTVVEAQRESYMANDAAKFAELAQPVKLTPQGDGKDPDKKVSSFDEAQDKLSTLMAKKLSDNKDMDHREARRQVMQENEDIRAALAV